MEKWKSVTKRNWFVDVSKWFFMVALVVGHANAVYIMIAAARVAAGADDGPRQMPVGMLSGFRNVPSPGMADTWYGWLGYYTIALFCILCGYWFISSFKKQQALGIHKKERTFKLTANFFGDSVRRYWPHLVLAINLNVIMVATVLPKFWNYEGLLGLWKHFRNALPFSLGLTSLGYTHSEMLGGLPILNFGAFLDPATGEALQGTFYKVNYSGSLWFLSALLIFSVLWYLVFLKSETAGVFVWSLLHIAIYTNLGGLNPIPDMYMQLTALFGINTEYWRIFGDFGWGVILWYIVQYMRRDLFTKKGRIIVTVLEAATIASVVIMIRFGYGHMQISLLILFFFLASILSEVGYLTPAINKLLEKIPGIKHVGAIGLATYIYLPATCFLMSMFMIRGNWPWFSSLTWVNQMWVFLGIEFVWCVFYVAVVDRFIIQWVQRKLSKAFRLKETIATFVEEDAAAGEATVQAPASK